MVAFAEIETPEAPSGPLSFGYGAAVAVEDDDADAGELLSASAVCSAKQGSATFTGYITDNETGLLHARARQYSPTLGRFVSRDPWRRWEQYDYLPQSKDGYHDGYSLYSIYGVGNKVDPSGKKAEPPECDSFTYLCQTKTPDSNGCGPGGWKGKLVPEMPLGLVDFTPPCDEHDKCYATCGSSQKKCDDDFLSSMQTACFLKYGWMVGGPNPPPPPAALQAKLELCMGLAKIYHAAVAAGGAQHHRAAQKEYCGCCCGPLPPPTGGGSIYQ